MLVAPAPATAQAPAPSPASASASTSQPDAQPQPRASATHPTRQIHPICFFRSVSDVLDATVVRNSLYWMLILYHLPQPCSHVQHCSKASKRFCDPASASASRPQELVFVRIFRIRRIRIEPVGNFTWTLLEVFEGTETYAELLAKI